MTKDFGDCLASRSCRLRFKCRCAQCEAATRRRTRAQGSGGVDLADLLANELFQSDQDAESTSSALVCASPHQKLSVVTELPLPAGGFCRRSAAMQWAMAQESRKMSPDHYGFDCAEHDWPELFQMEPFDEDCQDCEFDFELVDGEEDEDDFVLEMVEEGVDEESMAGEWAKIFLAAKTNGKDITGATTAANIAAAANLFKLDFRKAIAAGRVQRVPKMPSICRKQEEAAIKAPEDPLEDWPALTSASTDTAALSSSPSSVCDVAGQWVNVVEKSTKSPDPPVEMWPALAGVKEVRLPAEDKKSRNFREVCRRTAAQERRAAKQKELLKILAPQDHFPALET